MRRWSLLVVLATWVALAAGAQRWVSIEDGIREGWGRDVASYLVIARAAPSLPDEPVRLPFAERFPAHWVTGAVADATGAPLEDVYRALSVLIVGALLLVLHATFLRLGLDAHGYAVALGVLAASAYPLHFLLAASGFVADDLFLLGLALALLGFVRVHLRLVVAGLVLATLGARLPCPSRWSPVHGRRSGRYFRRAGAPRR